MINIKIKNNSPFVVYFFRILKNKRSWQKTNDVKIEKIKKRLESGGLKVQKIVEDTTFVGAIDFLFDIKIDDDGTYFCKGFIWNGGDNSICYNEFGAMGFNRDWKRIW